MPANDPRVDAYIAKSAEFARPVLARLRATVHATCPDAEETLRWRVPHFTYRGKLLCSLAAFKQHAAFGFWHVSLRKSLADPAPERAWGQLGRLTSVKDLPSQALLRRTIRKAMALTDKRTTGRPAARAPRKPLRVPSDLSAALARNARARSHFQEFSPSRKRDYVEWLTDARVDATRRKRLETAVRWMGEGKSRNWKYEKKKRD